ncbi:MAG TPA: YkgJ family cysteine cluster protein [Geobacteraceae bacterium]|nr:YkgJ family cysteine cluster protein [Geobacteraceae bacterium]
MPYESLANYLAFLERVDKLCSKITAEFAAEILCRAGCSGCCRHLNLFTVEAAHLADAVRKLSPEAKELLAGRIDWAEEGSCPLLLDGCCLVYRERPVICRTHGLPLITEIEGERMVDFCEENFRGVTSLSGDMVIDLDTLNRTLVAINGRFESETHGVTFRNKRYSIAEIIRIVTSSRKDTR